MNNFREVNEDILKEWLMFREDNNFYFLTEEDKNHNLNFDDIAEKIMKNVPNKNKNYVKKQFEFLYNDFMKYMAYYNEKYYRNGFVDGALLIMRCLDE